MADLLPDGVFLGLPFPDYIAQPNTTGSTNKGKMHTRKEGYWWCSPMNPFFKPEQTEFMLEGEAIHAILLEGLDAYTSRFVVEPNRANYPTALFTVDQIRNALDRAHVSIAGSSKFGKADWVDAALVHLPGRPVWDHIMNVFEDTRGDRLALDPQTDFQIRAMWAAATAPGPETEEVRGVLGDNSAFPVLAEVSVFYHDETGMRHRARFDKILPNATVDLKSVGGWQDRPLVHSLDDIIKRNAYDIQVSDYQIARRRGFEMVLADESALHGGTQEERAHFLAMAHHDMDHRPSWAWLFFQKPDNTGRAPILFPLVEEWGGRYHRSGFRKRARALALYHQCMERFGPDTPWSRIEPMHFTDEAFEPHISLGHYGWDDVPVEGEEEFFAT